MAINYIGSNSNGKSAQETLEGVRSKQIELRELESRIAHYKALKTRAEALLGADGWHVVVKIEAEIKAAKAQYEALIDDLGAVDEMIASLPDGIQASVLRLHYVEGMPMEQVSEVIAYSPRQTYRLCRAALYNLDRMQAIS